MTLNFYQKKAVKTLIRNDVLKNLIIRMSLGLCGESGEIAEKVKKYMREDYGEKELKEKIKSELGDVLWYIATLSNLFNINLGDIAKENIEKLAKRKKERKIRGEGDNR